MAMPGPGRSASVLSSVTFQLLLKLTTIYFVFYFLFTLGLIIRKSVKGNLTESEGYILANLIVTGTTILLTVYFLVWQTYVMWADVFISSVLLVVYGLDGVLAFSTLARLARSVPHHRHFILNLTSHDR
ncbi:transmembrane protein 80-like isoform X4 [Siniperca chuatsi]|uniref:transmembrane protein 80-like isoform X4 n=1 Tax=Siniperca chuatsi TaxID=119488 RepID=UPI001CE0295C|nr:transmembrane protein 80-like isoform X4 [Siniperca chuatsi]